MSEPTLFPMTPVEIEAVEAEKKSYGVRLTEKRESFIARGFHPLAHLIPGLLLHRDAHKERDGQGPRCGTCKHRTDNGWNKCGYYVTGSATSDLRLWWPACTRYIEEDK